ncbi:MAG: hypothetical protein AAF202_07830 [Pseudomonadota bacterium]
MKKLTTIAFASFLTAACTPIGGNSGGGGKSSKRGFIASSQIEKVDVLEAMNQDEFQVLGKASQEFFNCSGETTLSQLVDQPYKFSYNNQMAATIEGLSISASMKRRYIVEEEQVGTNVATYESDLLSFSVNGNNMFRTNTYSTTAECRNRDCEFLATETFTKGSAEKFLEETQKFERRMQASLPDDPEEYQCEFEADPQQMEMSIQDGTYEGYPAFRVIHKLKGTDTCPGGRTLDATVEITQVRLKDEIPLSKGEMDDFDGGFGQGPDGVLDDFCDNGVDRTLVQIRAQQKSAGKIRFGVQFRFFDFDLETAGPDEEEAQEPPVVEEESS